MELPNLSEMRELFPSDRKGFIVKNISGWYNAVVYNESTQEWFLWDEDVTEKTDLEILMVFSGIEVVPSPPILEKWMTVTGTMTLLY